MNLFLSILISASLCTSCIAAVKQTGRFYSCCDLILDFNQDCENTWSQNKQSFATFKQHVAKQCTSPCKELDDGRMTLDSCTSVNVLSVCTNARGLVEEERVLYLSQPCSDSVSGIRANNTAPGNQGSVRLLLTVVTVGQFVMQMFF